LFNGGYRAPHKRLFPVAGRDGKATILGSLVNMRDGGFISQHDFHIASLIANVVTGGDVEPGTLVNEDYLMTLERQAFCSLIVHPKTQERILGKVGMGALRQPDNHAKPSHPQSPSQCESIATGHDRRRAKALVGASG
jgi:3-hydroxyacyl-CoA dehydrogenase